MKVLFLLLDGPSNASSFHRVTQYLPLLRARGIEPSVSAPPLYDRLIEHGHSVTGEKLAFYGAFLGARAHDVVRADRFDVVVVQRDLFPFGPPMLESLLRRRARRLVYDTDDATYLRPAFTPRTPFQRLRRFDKVRAVVQRADWVTVATEPIARWARQFNARVDVLPMAVDLPTYAAARRVQPGQGTVIGWAGTAGGVRYLNSLQPILRDLAARVPFTLRAVSGGYRHIALPGVPLEARPWRAESALHDIAAFDVGLVPLDDTEFERAKFPFKLLQYLALGVPLVSARVGEATRVISDGDNGLLASTPEEWSAALERVLLDRELRARLSAAGPRTVAEHYTLERVGARLADGLFAAAR